MLVDVCSIMYDEEVMLPMWLDSWLSLPFINNIYLVDGGSVDQSYKIADRYGSRVNVIQIPWRNDFSRQRNIAIKRARADWIIQPDIDELPCNLSNFKIDFDCGANELHLPYLKFYDWNKLWFFNDGHTPCLKDGVVEFGHKSTLTIFKRKHLAGYSKSLHEEPLFTGPRNPIYVCADSHGRGVAKLDQMKFDFFVGHYDQAKHFLQAKRNNTSVELEMGLKRARYRLISPAAYDGKVYDEKWAKEALLRLVANNPSMIEELGAAQLKSFLQQHTVLEDFDAMSLNNEFVRKHVI